MEKQVAKNFIIYSLPDVLTKCVFLLILPVTTIYLTAEDFGYLALFVLCSVPFSLLAEFGAGYIINSTWFKLDKHQRAELLFNLLSVSALLHLLAIIIITAFNDKVFTLLLGENWVVMKEFYWLLILKVFSGIPSSIFLGWVIIEQKAKLSSIIQSINIVLTAGVTLVIAVLTGDYKYIILGGVIVFVFISLTKIFVMFPMIKVRVRASYLTLIYKVGSPIFLRSIFNQIRKQIDTFFVARLFGVGQLALYDFSKRSNNAFAATSVNYNKSYEPMIYKQLSEGKLYLANLRRILLFWFYITCIVSVFLFIFGQPLISLFTHGVFEKAYPLLLLFLCVLLLRASFFGDLPVLIYYQKTMFIFISTIIQGVLSIVLCAVLIPIYGVKGGIIAIWAGTIVYYGMNFLMKQKLHPEWFIEKTVSPYVLAFHILVVLQVFLNINIPSILLLSLLFILTVHGYTREKEFIKRVCSRSIKSFHRRVVRFRD